MIQGIKEIVKKLEFSDEINNPFALKELFHRYGVNMRFEWVVYCKLKNSKLFNLKKLIYFLF